MQFSILTIEVDGTLQNPYVLAGFTIWTAQLSIAMAILLRDLYLRQLPVQKRRLFFTAILVASYFVGRIESRMISTLLYMISTSTIRRSHV